MDSLLCIRLAVTTERETLEALQVRAALSNEGDRDALLANPDAIVLPLEQILAAVPKLASTGTIGSTHR